MASRSRRPPTTVLVEVPPKPAFTIEKLQEINSSGLGFTTTQLTGAIGQAVNYEIVVTNTGNVPLKFSANSATPTAKTITPAGARAKSRASAHETYTCNHVLTEAGAYTNEATVTGTPESGTPVITHTSNHVVVEVPAKPAFTIEKLQYAQAGGASALAREGRTDRRASARPSNTRSS